jgi:glycosyltransferase involved in cell wall biosynthesis
VQVAILSQYYSPEMGAPQSRLSDLASHLRRRGHDVVVLTAMPNYPEGKVFEGYGGVLRREHRAEAEVIRTWIWPSASKQLIPRLLSYLSFTVSAATLGLARLPKIDVLVTESPPLTLGLTSWLIARVKRARLVFNVSDLWPESAVTLGMLSPNGSGANLAYRLEAFSYRSAWRVSGQSAEILASVEARFPDVATLPFPGGVDTTRFRPDAGSPEVRRRVLGDEPIIALYAGLHGLAQGLESILDAAERLSDLPDLAIVLVGSGPMKPTLEESARRRGLRNVRFVDVLPPEQVPAVLAAADIALVPLGARLVGAVPSKLYEAMASAVPVVVAADGEPAEIVASAGGGIAVSPGDVDGLATALRRLAADEDERRALGAAGRRAACERHDRRVICDRFIDALEDAQ